MPAPEPRAESRTETRDQCISAGNGDQTRVEPNAMTWKLAAAGLNVACGFIAETICYNPADGKDRKRPPNSFATEP